MADSQGQAERARANSGSVGLSNYTSDTNTPSRNIHLEIFERYYPRMAELPIDSMWPVLVSQGMLRDNVLRGRISSTLANTDKARLLLEPVYTDLKVGVVDRFTCLLEAVTTYANRSYDPMVMEFLCDIKKDLQPEQDINQG